MVWVHESYGSGTQIVTRNNSSMPHYYVYGDARSQVCDQLAEWLNTGKRPSWASTLKRNDHLSEFCAGSFGIRISATGPMSAKYTPQMIENPERRERVEDWARQQRIDLIGRLFE